MVRNVASWVVGVYWGTVHVVGQPGVTDWGDVILVMGCMSLPLAYKVDDLIKARIATSPRQSVNGSDEETAAATP